MRGKQIFMLGTTSFLSWASVAVLAAVLAVVPVSYTHLRAHETVLDLVCRLLLEKKQQEDPTLTHPTNTNYTQGPQ